MEGDLEGWMHLVEAFLDRERHGEWGCLRGGGLGRGGREQEPVCVPPVSLRGKGRRAGRLLCVNPFVGWWSPRSCSLRLERIGSLSSEEWARARGVEDGRGRPGDVSTSSLPLPPLPPPPLVSSWRAETPDVRQGCFDHELALLAGAAVSRAPPADLSPCCRRSPSGRAVLDDGSRPFVWEWYRFDP